MAASRGSSGSSTFVTRLPLLVLLCIFTSLLLFPVSSASPLADWNQASSTALHLDDPSADLPYLSSHSVTQARVGAGIHQRDSSSTASAASSAASTTSTSTPSASSLPPPAPFDTSLGNNFTASSCPAFFNSFLTNSTFKSCVPFSLLLQNSNAFFSATASNLTLNPVLDDSCSASYQTCAPLMASFASQLTTAANCANDYALGNPLVVQAYRGLLSYAPMYNASCLKADPTGRSSAKSFPYCYTSALNSSSGADSMLYFLPLGLGLPGGTSISCSSCTQQTMAIYANAASDAKSPLNSEYLPAATMINSACGNNFVNANPTISKTASTAALNSASRANMSLLFVWIAAVTSAAATCFL